MNTTRGQQLGLATAILAAIGISLADVPTFRFALPYLLAIATGSFVAIAWTAANSYRTGRDPALLYVAVGSGTVAAQLLLGRLVAQMMLASPVFNVHRSLSDGLTVLTAYAPVLGALALAVCLALAAPWWERRGRRPPSPSMTGLAVFVPVLLVDVIVVLGSPESPELFKGTVWVAIVASVIAIGHTFLAGGWFGWLAGTAACLAFALTPYALPTSWAGLIDVVAPWARSMPLVGALLLLAGVLATQQAVVSRMRRATDRADEVLGGRAEIASVISHDVRSPVSSIKSIAASTIANYDRLDDAQRLEFVGMIEREAELALGIVHQMSVALRIDAGTLELVRRPTTIATVVRQAIDESETDGRRIEVEAAPGVTANVDAKWLAEAVRQGLDNAAAFSPDESSIRVGVEDGGEGAATITIEDEGPGIPLERRDEVFQRFARWRPPGYTDVPGSGLGLFICRGIVREHGGEATLGSGRERGTILRISLPWGAE